MSAEIIKDIQAFHSQLVEQLANCKDECLKGIMKQCLGREPVIPEDAKRFQIVTHERYPGREFIGFDGNMVGEIKFFSREENFQNKVSYEFEPKTMIDKKSFSLYGNP